MTGLWLSRVHHRQTQKKLPSLDNEVSTVTDMIDVLVTTGNIYAQVTSYLS